MRQNPHVQIRRGLGSATTLVYPTVRQEFRDRIVADVGSRAVGRRWAGRCAGLVRQA